MGFSGLAMRHYSHIAMNEASSISRTFVRDGGQGFSHSAPMARPTSKKAANHLRAWREFRGLTQEELANKVDTAGNVIGLIESGERGLSHKWLLKLAPALGTTPGFLLDHDPNDLDTAYLDAALSVPKDKRPQALEILKTFKRAG